MQGHQRHREYFGADKEAAHSARIRIVDKPSIGQVQALRGELTLQSWFAGS